MNYTITNTTITVLLDGDPKSVSSTHPEWVAIRNAVLEGDEDKVRTLLEPAQYVKSWAKDHPELDIQGEEITYKGETLPPVVQTRVRGMVARKENPEYVINFQKRCAANPNPESVVQLLAFLEHGHFPLQKDGTFLGYKKVRSDLTDIYSGRFDNNIGNVVKMPREQVAVNPNSACSTGLHVGSLGYARTFGSGRLIVVEVDPANVVSVPYDHNNAKLRCCEYKVVGFYGNPLPDTILEESILEEPDLEDTILEESDPTPVPVSAVTSPGKPVGSYPCEGTIWDHYLHSVEDRLAAPLGELRKFATYNCGIKGASKIPGGKEALLALIEGVLRGPEPEVVEPEPEVVEPSAEVVKSVPAKSAPANPAQYPVQGTPWDHMLRMSIQDLREQTLDDLRKFARHNLLIVGASKISGGKNILVAQILSALNPTSV